MTKSKTRFLTGASQPLMALGSTFRAEKTVPEGTGVKSGATVDELHARAGTLDYRGAKPL